MKKSIPGILFFIGILIASSDGQWFPWINFAGVMLLPLAIFIGKNFLE